MIETESITLKVLSIKLSSMDMNPWMDMLPKLLFTLSLKELSSLSQAHNLRD